MGQAEEIDLIGAEDVSSGAERFASLLGAHLRSSAGLELPSGGGHRGVANLRKRLVETFERGLKPPPRLQLSEWADRYAYLSPENSAEPGKWTTIGYQKGIMNAVTDRTVETITMKKSARVGYTKILDHVIGYFAHQDPSPMMVLQPTIQDAKDYSVDEIIPMVRDTPVLSRIAISDKEKGSGVTQLKRKFLSGASLLLSGAESPRAFRRVTVRVLLFDEVDGYNVTGAGQEGDQIKLGINRTLTFWNRKIIIGSTPTIKGVSRVSRSFENSDKRYFAVPCPHCNERSILKFSPAAEYGDVITPPDGIGIAYMKWPKDEPEKACFECPHCGCDIEEKDKVWMIETAAKMENDGWVATAPFNGHAGFHIWTAYSVFPNARWGILAREFLNAKRAKDNQELQVFVNTVLGEAWEDRGERVDDGILEARREDYGDIAPREVIVITAGVDIQGNRIEAEKVGWGLNRESWGLGKKVLYGDPTGEEVWNELDAFLSEPVMHEGGFEMNVAAACIDSGYLTQTVVLWCQQRWGRRWWATKGMAGPGRPIWPRKVAKTKGKLTQFIIGVDAAKEMVYANLRITEPGPGYCHFNMSYDRDHFEQMTAEEVVVKYVKGLPVRQWQIKGGGRARNEALDIRVGALAALEGLRFHGLKMSKQAAVIANRAGAEPIEDRPETIKPAPQPVEMAPVRRVKSKARRRVGRSSLLR